MYTDVAIKGITLTPTSNRSADSKVKIMDTLVQVHSQNKLILWAYFISYFEGWLIS